MSEQKSDINSNLLGLGTILQYIKEYGVWGVCKSIILLFVLIITMRICYDPDFLFEKYRMWSEINHQREQECRRTNDDAINRLLPTIMVDTRANRVWIVQYHNGTSDWTFGSMRFELCLGGTPSIQNEYDNFHLSWLKLPGYLRKNQYFIGNLEELSHIDHILHDKYEMNNVAYSACILVKANGVEVGVLGLTWKNDPEISKHDILLTLERYAGKLEELLLPQIKK